MERVCSDCGRVGKLKARGLCATCYQRRLRRARSDAAKETCPGCGERRHLHDSVDGPRCHRCVRRAAPRKQPIPRHCKRCGRLRRHAALGLCGSCYTGLRRNEATPRSCRNCGRLRSLVAHGLCNACYQRDPLIVGVWVQGAEARLADRRPAWFGALAGHLLERCATGVCLRHLRRVEAALLAGQTRSAELLTAVIDRGRSGRSPGDTARLLEIFLVGRGLLLASDERGRLAAGRRQRRVERCPPALLQALERYLTWLLAADDRARRRGEPLLADHTIERRVETIAKFGAHLLARDVRDWAAASRSDIDAFLEDRCNVSGRLASLRDFFRWARRERLVLSDPTRGLRHRPAPGFAGRTVPLARQAELVRRWSSGECHPHEALVGLLALLHAASPQELCHLELRDVDRERRTVRLGRRLAAVPLDPLSASALERCLEHRDTLGTENPHVIVTRSTRAHCAAASSPYLSHVLDAVGVSPRVLRQTRLVDLTHRIDPRLVADAIGITAEGALHYFKGAVAGEAAAFGAST
jgi:site-specific recombinase XerD